MWKFQVNESGQTDGWNDNGIQTFRSNILKNLAREIIQNSVDARASKSAPAEVEFILDDFDKNLLPDFDQLNDHIENIAKSDAVNEGDSHKKEIDEALKCVEKSKFKVLLISDRNTMGMPHQGVSDTSSAFFRYMKATGSSGGDQSRAGSHGLGKAAPLATTPLRTIFVATSWEEKGVGLKSLFQGRCRLMSRKIDGKIYSGTGFWGDEDYQPVSSLISSKYDWLKREVRGTTIAVPGFRTQADREWSSVVTGYIISEFFAAIARKTLRVKVTDKTTKNITKYEISSEKINELFNNNYIKEQMRSYVDRDISDLQDAEFYSRCLSLDEASAKSEEFEVEGLGKVRLRFIVEENAPRKICFIRKDMKITEELSAGKSGKSLWRPGHVPAKIKDFGGVVEVLDEDGERLLRSMEPPQHNRLSIDNMPESDRESGKKVLGALSQKLREIIEEHATAEVLEEKTVSELAEYFYDDSEYDADSATISKEMDPNGRLVIRNKPIVQTTSSSDTTNDGTEGGSGGSGGSGGGGGGGHGSGSGSGTGGTGKKKKNPNIPLKHQRLVRTDKNYIANLRVNEPFDGYISIMELGVDLKQKVKLTGTTKGELSKDGRIKISKSDFDDNTLKIELELHEKPAGGLTIEANKE
ncbi:hypothetical protein GN286_14140 [Rhodobacteraceae bacterium IMCC15231]|nr:hypothetical protein [Rhodobacteraceae bacterium IMCC15231]